MDIKNLIDKYHENNQKPHRGHLGASQIGSKCRRALWYSFRWASDESFSGRMLRLFRHGFEYEKLFLEDLNAIGYKVITKNRKTGEDIAFRDHDGHFSGTVDGMAQSPDGEWLLLEFKTHNDKSFKQLQKKGVLKHKPQHFHQMQVYMHYMKVKKGLYLSVNKNDDELYHEWVEYNSGYANKLIDKARVIIDSFQPPERISDDPKFFDCKFCPHNKVCHDTQLPNINCRTCEHAMPAKDKKWSCNLHEKILNNTQQRQACPDHRYIFNLVPEVKQPEYENLSSEELAALPDSMVGDKNIKEMREVFDAKIVKG